jgi:hypothetical protein
VGRFRRRHQSWKTQQGKGNKNVFKNFAVQPLEGRLCLSVTATVLDGDLAVKGMRTTVEIVRLAALPRHRQWRRHRR